MPEEGPAPQPREKQTGRLEAFSENLFAIAITPRRTPAARSPAPFTHAFLCWSTLPSWFCCGPHSAHRLSTPRQAQKHRTIAKELPA